MLLLTDIGGIFLGFRNYEGFKQMLGGAFAERGNTLRRAETESKDQLKHIWMISGKVQTKQGQPGT